MIQFDAQDVADYVAGVTAAQDGGPLRPAPYVFRLGWYDAKANKIRAVSVGTILDGSWGALSAPTSAADAELYRLGYLNLPSGEAREFWYRVGRWEATNGIRIRLIPVGLPGPLPGSGAGPGGMSPPGGGNPPRAPQRVRSEVLYLELYCTIAGRRSYYDQVVDIDGWISGNPLISAVASFLRVVRFQFLGDAPGEDRQGYRLSGEDGPIAQEVARLVAAGMTPPNPAFWGLPAWVGTATSRGRFRLLGREEIAALDLLPQLYRIAEGARRFRRYQGPVRTADGQIVIVTGPGDTGGL